MSNALREIPATLLSDNFARLLRLLKVPLQVEVQRKGETRENDRPGTIAPSPTDLIVELVRDLGASECGDDVRRGGEGVG